jgi:hypothetical protein
MVHKIKTINNETTISNANRMLNEKKKASLTVLKVESFLTCMLFDRESFHNKK